MGFPTKPTKIIDIPEPSHKPLINPTPNVPNEPAQQPERTTTSPRPLAPEKVHA